MTSKAQKKKIDTEDQKEPTCHNCKRYGTNNCPHFPDDFRGSVACILHLDAKRFLIRKDLERIRALRDHAKEGKDSRDSFTPEWKSAIEAYDAVLKILQDGI